MYEPLLEYARQKSQQQIRKIAIQNELAAKHSDKTAWSERFLLELSDLLLYLGNRIRPKSIYASAHESLMKQNNGFAKTIEGV